MELAEVRDFGGIAADVDELLRDCFTDHPAYVSARSGESFLVIGRKGSGKTAIYQKLLLETEPQFFKVGHTFDDYPWEHHDLQAQAGVPEERRYIHSWKYLILMTLSKILLNFDQSAGWSDESFDALGDLETFVVDSYGSRDPDITQLFSPDRELHFKGKLNLGVGAIEAERLRIRELPLHVQEVNAQVQARVLTALNPENEYFVCFDQLDLGFSLTDSQYFDRLTGLILAARDLQRAAKEVGKRLSIIVFLRDDLYALLQFEDKNKVTEADVTTVEWKTDGDARSTLKGLMERRFEQTLDRDGGVNWSHVFDETKEMPSRQTKYQHICDRTFLRPRDMIKFCNEVLACYKQRGEPGEFTNEDVHAARQEYSDYLLRELDDEIAKHVPRYKEYLEVLGALGRDRFSRTQFHDAWTSRPALDEVDPDSALQELFDFSVVGYLKTGGAGGGSQWAWRYLDPRPYRAVVPADAETFRVHRGFKEALDLVQGAA